MAASPSVTLIQNVTSGRVQNLLLGTPSVGATNTNVLTAPIISNQGYGGTVTSGSMGYYNTNTNRQNTIVWTDGAGDWLDTWVYATAALRNTALTSIYTAVTAGTSFVAV